MKFFLFDRFDKKEKIRRRKKQKRRFPQCKNERASMYYNSFFGSITYKNRLHLSQLYQIYKKKKKERKTIREITKKRTPRI
jgi:hypothetical protein